MFLLCLIFESKAVIYDLKNYSLEQGLPQSQVFSLFQDNQNYVLVGTNGGGLAKFDGRYFTKYSSKHGLYGITVTVVGQINDDEFLVGTDIGIFKFLDGYPDQFGGPQGKKFKMTNFRNLLLEIEGKVSDKQRDMMERQFNVWKGDLEQVDDVLVIGIKIM